MISPIAQKAIVHQKRAQLARVFYKHNIPGLNLTKHLLVVLVDDSPPFECFDFWTGFHRDPTPDAVSPTSALFGRTPNIDGLANKGLRVTGARASPVCSPSRASIHTGMYACRHGLGSIVRADGDGDLAEFGDLGYTWPVLIPKLESLYIDDPEAPYPGVKCGWVGKTHLSEATTSTFTGPRYAGRQGMGWAIFNLLVSGATYLWTHLRNLNQTPVPGGGSQQTGGYYNYFYNTTADDSLKQSHTNDGHYAVTDQADAVIDFFSQVDHNGGQRSFMYWPVSACHSPFGIIGNPHRDFPPDDLVRTQEYKDKAALEHNSTWETFLAMMEAVDTELGRVLASIPPNIRQTLTVLVTDDNGTEASLLSGMHAETDLFPGWSKDYGPDWAFLDAEGNKRVKESVYHWGGWVNWIWSGPEPERLTMAKAGQISHGSVDAVDLFPTIIEYFGGTATPCDGISALPLVYDTAVTHLNHARQFNYTEKFLKLGNWRDITVGEPAEGDPTDFLLHQSPWLWITEENGFAVADGYTPQGRFSLVRKLINGVYLDRVFHHLDHDGVQVDLFEKDDKRNDPAYALHYAALLEKLDEILNGGPPLDGGLPIRLEDGTSLGIAELDDAGQVPFRIATGEARTLFTEPTLVPGKDELGNVIDFPLIGGSTTGDWFLLFDLGVTAPLTPYFALDSAELLHFKLEDGTTDATFESTHETTPNRIAFLLEDGTTTAHFLLVQD